MKVGDDKTRITSSISSNTKCNFVFTTNERLTFFVPKGYLFDL